MTRHWPEAGGSESRPYGCVQNQAVKRMRIAAARFDCKTLTTSFRHLSFPFLGVSKMPRNPL